MALPQIFLPTETPSRGEPLSLGATKRVRRLSAARRFRPKTALNWRLLNSLLLLGNLKRFNLCASPVKRNTIPIESAATLRGRRYRTIIGVMPPRATAKALPISIA